MTLKFNIGLNDGASTTARQKLTDCAVSAANLFAYLP